MLRAPAAVARALARRFSRPPLRLDDAERGGLLERLARAGIVGGAICDGLVALEAAAHQCMPLTLDECAQSIHQRVGAPFLAIAG